MHMPSIHTHPIAWNRCSSTINIA